MNAQLDALRAWAVAEGLATLGVAFYDSLRGHGNDDYHARQQANVYMNRKAPDLEYATCAELLADALAHRATLKPEEETKCF